MSIEIQNLNKSYSLQNEKLHIIRDLSANIKTGEVVAVVGASGSGKSTVLSLLSGLDTADSGTIRIHGTDICQLSSKDLIDFRSKNISIVFQQFHLVSHLTAFENVTLPLEIQNKDFDKEKIYQALDAVGLRQRAEHRPTELSGGESQRLAIARALISNPSLLLADEPSGNLDVETGGRVMKLFFDQVRRQKTTTVLVTHDLSLAGQCDRQLILKNGKFEA